MNHPVSPDFGQTMNNPEPPSESPDACPSVQSRLIDMALAEDAAWQDLTAEATIPAGTQGHARITAKAVGVLSGVSVADEVFAQLDARIDCHWLAQDGEALTPGHVVAELSGPLASLLAAERTALNFLQHLSGIATATQHFVAAVEGLNCRIADTRKTTPGMRALEKQAVIHGGGVNHRMDLVSGMLIKENHIKGSGSITDAVNACFRLQSESNLKAWVEVECETQDEVREAIAVCPDIILLDNMTPAQVREARALVPTSILLEASGNITLANARSYAETGVDRIAIGAISHSAPALDLSMLVEA